MTQTEKALQSAFAETFGETSTLVKQWFAAILIRATKKVFG